MSAIPRTLMERVAALERRVAELERELRAARKVGVIPTSLRVVNPQPEVPWAEPPSLMPMPHLDAARYPTKETDDGYSR